MSTTRYSIEAVVTADHNSDDLLDQITEELARIGVTVITTTRKVQA